MWIVSRSRISPTRITSGSWRSTCFSADANDLRVLAHLALVDHRALVAVQELDRVLDGHDVHRLGAVHDVDQRRERRRLAGAGRAGHEHEATRQVGEALDRSAGSAEAVEVGISYGIARSTAPMAPRWRNTFIRNRLLPGMA